MSEISMIGALPAAVARPERQGVPAAPQSASGTPHERKPQEKETDVVAAIAEPSKGMIGTLAEEVNRNLSRFTSLQFNVDGDSQRTVVTVVDRETDRVIRQIPSKQMLELAKRMEDLRGLLFDGKV